MIMTPFQQSPPSVSPDLPNMRLPLSSDDTGDGLLMFVVFIVAVLTSTAAVVLIALTGEWWVLGFGFAIHVIVTAIVVLTIVQAMAGSHRSIARRNALTGASVSPRSMRARSERAGAPTTIASSARLPAAALERRTHRLAAQDDRGSHQPAMSSARRDQASLAEGPNAGAGTHREPPRRRGPAAQASPLESDGSLGWQDVCLS